MNPILYKREDAEATWREIRAPTLMVLGQESDYMPRLGADGTIEALRAAYPGAEVVASTLPGTCCTLSVPRRSRP